MKKLAIVTWFFQAGFGSLIKDLDDQSDEKFEE